MNRTLPTLLTLSALLIAAAPAGAQDFKTRYRERVALFERENAGLDPDGRHVVLFGSSSMEGWRYSKRVARFLPNLKDRALNRGISGDGIGIYDTGLLRRLEPSVFAAHPSHVVILNGRNSIGRQGTHVEKTAEVYRQVIEEIQARLPGVVVIVATCPPTSMSYDVMAPHVVRFNAKLKVIAADLGCPVIDLHAQFADARARLPRSLTSDGLHFNDAGYRYLGAEIERLVAETDRPAAGEDEASDDSAGLPLPAIRPVSGGAAAAAGRVAAVSGAAAAGRAAGGAAAAAARGAAGAVSNGTRAAADEPCPTETASNANASDANASTATPTKAGLIERLLRRLRLARD